MTRLRLSSRARLRTAGWRQTARPSAATVERKERKRRQKERRAAGETAAPSASDWPELRAQIIEALHQSGLARSAVAGALQCKTTTLSTWLSRQSPTPGSDAQSRIRDWLARQAENAAKPEPEALPTNRLTGEQRNRLAAMVAFSTEKKVCADLGISDALLSKAIAGQDLAPAIISRLREGIAGNGATAE
jgi:transposase-like protein